MNDVTRDWYVPHLGNFLGEMTDEVTQDYGVGAYICEFASGGPKNYAYKVLKPDGTYKSNIKAKGITITEKAEQKLTFELISDLALKYTNFESNLEQNIEQTLFRSDKFHNVYTTKFPKIYKPVSDKRIIVQNDETYETVPYGFKFN